VRHVSMSDEFHAQRALGGGGHAIIRGLAVDEEFASAAVQLARHLIGGFGALAVAFLADEKKQTYCRARLAQALGGDDLRGDDALGIAGAASVDVVLIFGGGEPGRDDIHVSRENELRMAHAARHGKNIGALALDGKFARVITERAEMAMEEIADGSFVVGDGFDVDESASEGEKIHGRNLTFPDWLRFSTRLKKQNRDPSTRVSRAGECAREPSL